jgi:signal transduction histidine kinase
LEVFADVNMLRTVLRNLISNAIKFTNTGGHINVKSILKNNHVEISISDNGIGMNEEKHKFLFEIISNTTTLGTANENGSGLGLVLCKEFVNKNGGTIWAESEERKGSCFKFTLPLNQ